MAQTARAIKRVLLCLLPPNLRLRTAQRWPNLRKSMPEGLEFTYERYLGDVRVNINTRFKVERIMWSDAFEPALIRLLQRTTKPDWVAFDVGANVGAVSLAFARFIGPEGRIHAFEPGPPNLERLRANLALNPSLAATINVHAAGLGDTPGVFRWQEEEGNPGNAMLGSSGTHTVPVITLDDFVSQQALTRLDFIKVDVEGMELNVFRGAKQTLQKLRPVLYFETLSRFSDEHGRKNFSLIAQLLTGECRYKLYSLDRQGGLHPVIGCDFADYTVAVPAEQNAP
jgi:FkbM family methyltransferase